jgi:hypothetical protein
MRVPAKLSPQWIKEPPVYLEHLKPGESGWVDFVEMAIDSERRCYIDPKGIVCSDRYCKIHVDPHGGRI